MIFHRDQSFFDSKGRLYLNAYGLPEVAMANHFLINQNDYGESREELEEEWEKWIHHLPFDAPVAHVLTKLYERKLNKLDVGKDAAAYQRLDRKLKLIRNRAARYCTDSFSQGK
jgi:hypothetical protein